MTLSEIAAGLEVTTEQQECGVAETDDTGASLEERLVEFDESLPCSPEAAATVVDAYTEGAHVGRAAAVADVPKTTAAKALYLLGEPIDPLSPTAKRVVDDWLEGEISRTEAQTLAGVGEREFALGVYVATHDPIGGAESVVAEADSRPNSDPLADARSDLGDLI